MIEKKTILPNIASILPNLSKIFERCIFKQMSQFFEIPLVNV